MGWTERNRMRLIFWLDVFERVFVAFLFAWLLFTAFEDLLEGRSVALVIFLLIELVVVAFVVGRRWASAMSTDPRDWALAYVGSCLPLLVDPSEASPLVPSAVCVVLMLSGIACQLSGKFVLKRSFGVVAANRGVKTRGPYGLVRHPIYLGYTLSHVGFLLFAPSGWNLMVYALTLVLQVGRVLAEEKLLVRDAAYRTYAHSVRFRLVPGVF